MTSYPYFVTLLLITNPYWMGSHLIFVLHVLRYVMTRTRLKGSLQLVLEQAWADLWSVLTMTTSPLLTASLFHTQGSVVGGFLAQPASKYAAFQTPFFCQFPYLLPCLVGVGIGTLSLIGVWTSFQVCLKAWD